MPYNEPTADRIRELIGDQYEVAEKAMFSGLCFMVNDKMCICVNDHSLLCRIGPEAMETALEENGTGEMLRHGKAMKGYVYVDLEEVRTQQKLRYWVDKCLAYNNEAKSSKKKKA